MRRRERVVDRLIAAMRELANKDPAAFRKLAPRIRVQRRPVEKKSTK